MLPRSPTRRPRNDAKLAGGQDYAQAQSHQDMTSAPTSDYTPPGSDPFADPFRVLAIDPSVSDSGIEVALGSALERQTSDEAALLQAVAAIKDPERRLRAELAYPLDCPPDLLDRFDSVLNCASTDEALIEARHLPPLSRANFLVRSIVHLGISTGLLDAFIDSHAAIEATEIYRTLQKLRHQALRPPPSLVNVGEGLDFLLELHCTAIAAANANSVQQLVAALLEIGNSANVKKGRAQAGIFSILLNASRQPIEQALAQVLQRITVACESLEQHPENPECIDELARAFGDLAALAQGCRRLFRQTTNPSDVAWDQFSNLMARQLEAHQPQLALNTVGAVFGTLRSLPDELPYAIAAAAPFKERLSMAATAPLESQLERHKANLEPIVRSLSRSGFGPGSVLRANELWVALVEATGSSIPLPALQERPWLLMRQFASEFDGHAKADTAKRNLLVGLIQHGEAQPTRPSTLDLLREDLDNLKNPPTETLSLRRKRLVAAFCMIGILVTLGAVVAFQYPRSKATATEPDNVAKREPESLPAASRGKRYAREYVRYCHYQEERLRIVKQHVQGQEDIRAYNALATDYNARCADYFFQDEDLSVVKQEVIANRTILEADALRILSTWPWHVARPNQATTPAR
jgi:hypothetical protein